MTNLLEKKHITEAIILAGGFGTRLQHVIKEIPKPMAPINGVPFLSFVLNMLIPLDIQHVVLSTGYLHEKIFDFYQNRYKSLKISYAQETSPLGTGGGLRFALQQCETDNVLVLNGDTLFRIQFDSFFDFFLSKKADVAIALRNVSDVSRYGSVIVNEHQKIIRFTEKNELQGEGFINGGIYLLKKSAFQKFIFPEKFSFEKDFMEKYCASENFYGFYSDGYFIDIGIPCDYERAQRELPIH